MNYGEKKTSEKYSLMAGLALDIFSIAPEIITAVIVREKSLFEVSRRVFETNDNPPCIAGLLFPSFPPCSCNFSL